MLKLAADENFNNHILRALLRHDPTMDIIRIQDTEIAGRDDPTVLEWAAREQRLLLTHDVKTIPDFAYERVNAGLPMPGVIEVKDGAPIAEIVEDIVLLVGSSLDNEWEAQVVYIPFPRNQAA